MRKPHSRRHRQRQKSPQPTDPVMALLGVVLLVVAVLLLLGTVPAWPYSREWGYRPSGLLGFLVVVLLILFLLHVV